MVRDPAFPAPLRDRAGALQPGDALRAHRPRPADRYLTITPRLLVVVADDLRAASSVSAGRRYIILLRLGKDTGCS